MNSPQPRVPWSELAQPRSWSLPVKIAAVVAVPALFALGLGTLRVLDQSAVADDFNRIDRVAALQERYSLLTQELQQERDQAVQFVAVRDRRDWAPFEDAAEETDRAHSDATALLGDRSDLSSGAVGALLQVDNNYFRLTQLRRQVLTGANDASDLTTQYSSIVEPLLVFDSAVTRQLSNPEISGLSQAIGALGEAREQVTAQQAVVTSVLDGGKLVPAQADAIHAADSRLATATSTVRSVLGDEQQARYTAFAGSVAATREQLKQSVLDRGRGNLPLEVAPPAWIDASTAVLKEIDSAEAGARSELREISAKQQDAASNRAGISSVFLLLAILLGAAIIYVVAKSLINSLRTLRVAALDVAERRLPEAVQSMREGAVPDIDVRPLPVTTREEIGQVARAFDAVHSQAVRLAAEQATLQSNVSSMFANLSRRSQALAERQLKLIEQLESNEQDPDQLSNLFQLDSLATRMRRNSENLLVLSGTDLSKRASQPVPVVDVLRAAVSEVEQYQRVVVQSPPDAAVAGRAASDIVHLLAELVDNATNFSPPDTQVVMSSERTPDGAVLIEIVDRGVGMGGDEVTDANERLARPTALDVSVSRRMGLFVVGRLAARHGLGVRLGGDPGGTTASVTVPAYLVTAAPGADPGGMAPAGAPRPGPAAQPGGDFVPSPRPGINGLLPAPLSALVAGGDAPVGSPGGPLPGTPDRKAGAERLPPIPLNGVSGPTNGTAPGRNGSANVQNRPSPGGPDGPPDAGQLPTRRPGQLLGQAPAPPSTTGPTAEPGSEPSRPAADDHNARPQPDERFGPQQGWPGQQLPRPEPVAGDASHRSDQYPVRPQPAPGRPGAAPQGQPGQSGQYGVRPQRGRPAEQTGSHPASPQPGSESGEQPRLFAGRPQPGPVEQAPGRPSEEAGAHPDRGGQPEAQPGRTARPGRSQPVAPPGNEQVRADGPDHRSETAPVTEAFAAHEAAERPAANAAPAQPADQQAHPRPAPRPAEASLPALPGTAVASFPALPAVPATPVAEQAPAPARPAEPPARRPAPTARGDAAAPLFAAATSSAVPARTGNDPSETTPIFEEIASAWFREDRPVPYEGGFDPSSPAPAPQSAPAPQTPQAPQSAQGLPPAQPSQAAAQATSTTRAPQAPPPGWPARPVQAPQAAQPAQAEQAAQPQQTAAPVPPAGRPQPSPQAPSAAPHAPERAAEPLASAPQSEFASAADDGWRASAAAAELGADELTPAGLPKRRPRARLVPGAANSVATAPAGGPAGPAAQLPANSARTAEAIRGRLSSYQDGVRQGREMRLRRAAGRTDVPSAMTPGSTGHRDEETS